MSKFSTYEEPIMRYCRENNIDYDAIKDLEIIWGIDMLKIINKDRQIVLIVSGYDMNDLLFEQTELTSNYKINGAMAV